MTARSEYDMVHVGQHELTHALGFASYTSEDGSGAFGPPGTADVYAPWDGFLVNASGTHIINPDGTLNVPVWNAASVGGVGALFFDGANTRAMNGGQRANIYSPTTYAGGSSISHLDEDFYGLNTFLMNPATTIGPSIRGYSNLELGILRDIGYTHIGAVPEPASMIALGLGAAAMLRRRKRA